MSHCHIVPLGQVHYLDQNFVYTIPQARTYRFKVRVRFVTVHKVLVQIIHLVRHICPPQLCSVMGPSHTLTPKLAVLLLCAPLVGTQIAIIINFF